MQSIWSKTLCLILVSVLLLLGCSKSQSSPAVLNNQNAANQQPVAQAATSPVSALPASNSHGKVDACSLLTAEEVKAVQGEAFKETKASVGSENGMIISQCFFSLPTSANSVNLAVTQKGEGRGARDPRDFWEQTFEKSSKREGEKGQEKRSAPKGREEEEKGAAAQKVDGVGEEAFWTGTRVGGALYVLKHDSYIRVSVGGAGDQKTKIEKSKALARLALKRLS
jgi:hypothetical protein